jgi:hypothetical protein
MGQPSGKYFIEGIIFHSIGVIVSPVNNTLLSYRRMANRINKAIHVFLGLWRCIY